MSAEAFLTNLLTVLVSSHEELHDARNGAVLAQRCLVLHAERQVADETHHGLDERPAAWRMQQLDEHWQSVVKTHGVLCRLSVGVATGEMSERADGRLGDVLAVACLHDGAHERLDAAHLANRVLVLRVVACQVGEDSCSARHDVEVVGRQQLDE